MRKPIKKPFSEMTDAELDEQAAYIQEALESGRITSRFAASWQAELEATRKRRKE